MLFGLVVCEMKDEAFSYGEGNRGEGKWLLTMVLAWFPKFPVATILFSFQVEFVVFTSRVASIFPETIY